MSKIVDLTGQRSGRLTAVSLSHINRRAVWNVLCDCGSRILVRSTDFRSGAMKSCGCLKRERAAMLKFKHGHARTNLHTPTYETWRGMNQRCYLKTDKRYKRYGGNGVMVCERWRGEHGLEHFLIDMGERPKGTTLGRFGDVGNYEPGNVKWMTPAEQGAEMRKKNLKKAA